MVGRPNRIHRNPLSHPASDRFETRPATLEDLDQLLAHVQAGFDSYVAFAPSGWEPPSVGEIREASGEVLADPQTWALIALEKTAPVGHVSFYPGRERVPEEPPRPLSERPLIPGLAHFWQLFVLPQWWGTGVAGLLHDAAIDEMRARSFEQARLFTPSAHARARRFYERRGWTDVDAEWNEWFQLELTEYRLGLD